MFGCINQNSKKKFRHLHGDLNLDEIKKRFLPTYHYKSYKLPVHHQKFLKFFGTIQIFFLSLRAIPSTFRLFAYPDVWARSAAPPLLRAWCCSCYRQCPGRRTLRPQAASRCSAPPPHPARRPPPACEPLQPLVHEPEPLTRWPTRGRSRVGLLPAPARACRCRTAMRPRRPGRSSTRARPVAAGADLDPARAAPFRREAANPSACELAPPVPAAGEPTPPS